MRSTTPSPSWHVYGPVYVRACARTASTTLTWPDLPQGSPEQWKAWLSLLWEDSSFVEAIRHASPVLVDRAEVWLRGRTPRPTRARRLVAAVMRYLLRAEHRATPFGLFAGVTTASLTDHAQVRWNAPATVTSASGVWVDQTVRALESFPELLAQSTVTANPTATIKDGQLLIPLVGRPDSAEHALTTTREVRVGYSAPVATAMNATVHPVPWETVLKAVCEAHPEGEARAAESMLTRLVWAGALLSNLRPASLTPPQEHLSTVRTMAEASIKVGAIPKVPASNSPNWSTNVDLSWDATISLPHTVARAAEETLTLVEALSEQHPGLPDWRGWPERFIERYGTGNLVPVTEVVGANGVGYPSWDRTAEHVLTPRDRWLLECAQVAALDGCTEVDPAPVAELIPPVSHTRSLDHTEVNLRLESPSLRALEAGRFRLTVLGVSRAAVTMAGRAATTLTESAGQLRAVLNKATNTTPVQLSFPPLQARHSHVVRVPRLCDHVVHIAEHPTPASVGVDDLAVGHDEYDGLFVWSHTLGRRVEPVVPHALNLRFAPALARFLAELPRAERTPLTGFSWGPAKRLPFLPRLRSGRTVLCPAQWRIRTDDLPPARVGWKEWERAWKDLATRRRLPHLVELGGADRRLHLDLSEPDHRYLLRTHLDHTGPALLREAPDPQVFGWCQGRPTEILFQLLRGKT